MTTCGSAHKKRAGDMRRLFSFLKPELRAARYLFGTQALGADLGRTMGAVFVDANRLKIRQPAAARFVHSVADVVTRARALAADFTALRHVGVPLRSLISDKRRTLV
jgi:hypothetical protein